jgi:hypothetical protein
MSMCASVVAGLLGHIIPNRADTYHNESMAIIKCVAGNA